MKLFDEIGKMFNKNFLYEPKQTKEISLKEQFRKNIQERAKLSQEEIEVMQKEEERKRQIRIASCDVINTSNNLDNDEIKIILGSKLLYLKIQQLGSVRDLDMETEVILTNLDLETLKHIHYAVQKNPEVSTYLNSIDRTTRDNNIIEVVNRMEAMAKDKAKNCGRIECEAVNFMPNASEVIYNLQKEQKEQQEQQVENE